MRITTNSKQKGGFFMEQIAIFCDTDDFCKAYEEYCRNKLLMDKEEVIPRTRMSLSEIMKFALVPLILYTIKARSGKCSGISFVDSTPLKVCDNHRIYSHRVFKGYAKKGKSSMGWFYGFKLHFIINECGEILSFCLTSGNVDDRNEKVMESLTKEIFGKLFADRGYISSKLFEKLYAKNITLVTRAKKNMKNKLMDYNDRLMLRKRTVIESVNDFLKNICNVEHSRHRSVTNFLVNLLSALAAYSFLPKKPSICSASDVPQGVLCLID